MKILILYYKALAKFAHKIGRIKAELEFDANYLGYHRDKRKGYWQRKLKKIGQKPIFFFIFVEK